MREILAMIQPDTRHRRIHARVLHDPKRMTEVVAAVVASDTVPFILFQFSLRPCRFQMVLGTHHKNRDRLRAEDRKTRMLKRKEWNSERGMRMAVAKCHERLNPF